MVTIINAMLNIITEREITEKYNRNSYHIYIKIKWKLEETTKYSFPGFIYHSVITVYQID